MQGLWEVRVMQEKWELVIVGGGAAGLVGGILARRCGLEVVILERLAKVGRKLLATGGGRCNFTRAEEPGELLRGYYEADKFVRPALYNFPPLQVREFFAGLGVGSVVEEDNRVYPRTGRADEVLGALQAEYSRLGGRLETGVRVERILVQDGVAVGVQAGEEVYRAERVLLAGGGGSMSELGSDGSGFTLAREVGHKVVPPVAGLVGLVIPELAGEALAGVALPASLSIVGAKAGDSFVGDIIFTHKGLSGPAVLDMSRLVSRKLAQGESVELEISWGGKTREYWREIVLGARAEFGRRSLKSLLLEHLPRRFVVYLLFCQGVDGEVALAELKKEAQEKVVTYLTGARYKVERTAGLAQAMVTAGGVSRAEITPKTLESRVLPGLYFAGEVIDVDGRCGGYNLQWAFAAAALAVQSIAQSLGRGE